MNNTHAMIIDDSRVERYILTRQLNDIGITDITETDDGSSALEYLASHKNQPPCIIFLDINMPIINGFQFLEKFTLLRENTALESCYIFVYSSSDRSDDKEKVTGFDFVKGFLVKGQISPEVIKTQIEALA